MDQQNEQFFTRSVCWFANVTNTKVLENVQKKSMKWINKTSNNNYEELLYCSRILPLSSYLLLQDLLFLSKSLTGHFTFNIGQFVRGQPHVHYGVKRFEVRPFRTTP